jgi:hypothetical protein
MVTAPVFLQFPPAQAGFRGGQHLCSERDGPLPAAACSPAPILGLGADSTYVRNAMDRFLLRLVPPLPFWERGLGGEGKRCFATPQTASSPTCSVRP